MKKLLKNIFGARESGQSIIELLIAIGLLAILIPAILSGIIASRGGKAQDYQRVAAVEVLKDSQEAVRSIYVRDWALIETNGTYHPVISTDRWVLNSGPITSSGLTTSIVISDVYRDSGGVIVSSGGAIDPSTKEVVITVAWNTPFVSSINSTNYFTRFENALHTDTLEAEFNIGVGNPATTGIEVTNSSGGEVTLAAGAGGGDWCNPSESVLEEIDLPKSGKATSVVAIYGEAFAGTGENSAGESLADILITDTDPPVASIIDTIDGWKTNDIYGESDFAYIASDDNSKEAIIFDISSTPFTEIGYFDAPPNDKSESIYVSDNVGYIVIKEKLWNFDLSSKVGSRTALDSDGINLSKEGTVVYVVGNYAYVGITGDNDIQMDVIDVSDPSDMVLVGTADVNNQSTKDIYVNETGTRAYIVTNATSPVEREFHIVDITNKSNPVKVGPGYYTQGMSPEAVEVVTGNRAIIVGQGNEEYQVVDLIDEQNPTYCGGMEVDTGIFDAASVIEPDGQTYSYIVTGDGLLEFKIVQGGSGGGGSYSTSGVFESRTFDGVNETSWNRMIVNSDVPLNTTLEFKLAIKPGISDSCATVSFADSDFVGIDAQPSTFFPSIGGLIPFLTTGSGYMNPARCARYRAFLDTTDSSQSPVVYDVNLNYAL